MANNAVVVNELNKLNVSVATYAAALAQTQHSAMGKMPALYQSTLTDTLSIAANTLKAQTTRVTCSSAPASGTSDKQQTESSPQAR